MALNPARCQWALSNMILEKTGKWLIGRN